MKKGINKFSLVLAFSLGLINNGFADKHGRSSAITVVQPSDSQFHHSYNETDGLKIRMENPNFTFYSMRSEDHESMKRLFLDPTIMKSFTYSQKADTAEEFENRFNSWNEFASKNPFGRYTVWSKSDEKFIGYVHMCLNNNNDIDFEYIVAPNFQGKGYGKKITQTVTTDLLKHLKETGYVKTFNVQKMTAHVKPDNAASKKLLEYSGFQRVARPANDSSPEDWLKFSRSI